MKKEDAAVTKLYDLEHTVAAPLLESVTYPWEALPEIKAYILKVGALLPKEDDELQKIIVRFPGCVCHGIARKDDRHVFEVRTLLTDGQLSGKQSQDSQELRKFGDFMRVVRGLTVFNNCKTVKL